MQNLDRRRCLFLIISVFLSLQTNKSKGAEEGRVKRSNRKQGARSLKRKISDDDQKRRTKYVPAHGGYIFFMRGRSVWLCRGTDAGEYGAVCVNVVSVVRREVRRAKIEWASDAAMRTVGMRKK